MHVLVLLLLGVSTGIARAEYKSEGAGGGAAQRRSLLAGESDVDPSSCVVYTDSINADNILPAGKLNSFKIQLKDSMGANVTHDYTKGLKVECITDPDAPAGESFCEIGPVVSPLGAGLYLVEFVYGTIWGSHLEGKPDSSTVAQTDDPLPPSWFQGDNKLSITFNDTHLPGSPFQPTLKSEPEISSQYTQARRWIPAKLADDTDFSVVAQAWILTDSYRNWVRTPGMIDNFKPRLTDKETGENFPVFNLYWLKTNWYIIFEIRTTRVGVYTFEIFYQHPDNTTERLRQEITSGFGGGTAWQTEYLVFPDFVDTSKYALTEKQTQLVAGKTYTEVATLEAYDAYGNRAFLIAEGGYGPYPNIYPSFEKQDTSLIGVDVTHLNATINAEEVPIVGLVLSDSIKGHVTVNISNLIMAGLYRVAFTQDSTTIAELHVHVSANAPNGPSSTAWFVEDPVIAGRESSMIVELRDEFGNFADADPDKLAVRAHPEDGSSFIAMNEVELLSNSTYRVTIQDITRAGTYNFTVHYDGDPIAIQPSNVIQVEGGAFLVDPASSVVYTQNLTSDSIRPAGTVNSFLVQLRNDHQENVTSYYVEGLEVACDSDDITPSHESFCDSSPVIKPLGSGLYQVDFVSGTIWGSVRYGLPVGEDGFSTSKPIQSSYFQGDNKLNITFNGVHLPESPLPLTLKPEPQVSIQYSLINLQANYGKADNTSEVKIARLWRVTDRFRNWLRTPGIENNFEVHFTAKDTGDMYPVSKTWWEENWWIDFKALMTRAGMYSFQVFYIHSDNSLERMKLQHKTTKEIIWSSDFEVQPAVLELDRYSLEGLSTQLAAGQFHTMVATLQAHDKYGNNAWLVDPGDYRFFLRYGYEDQSMSFLSVAVSYTGSGSTPNSLPELSMSMSNSAPGLVLVNGSASPQAGQFRATFSHGGTAVAQLDFEIVAAAPHAPNCTAWNVRDPVVAGLDSEIIVELRDEFGNLATAAEGALTVTASPKGSSSVVTMSNMERQPNGTYSVSISGLEKAGNYTLSVMYDGSAVSVQPSNTFEVVHNPEVGAFRSVVTGYGSGVSTGELSGGIRDVQCQYDEDDPCGGPATRGVSCKEGALVAGRTYSIFCTAYDNFGNKHKDTSPGFLLNEDFVNATGSLSVVKDSDGKTVFEYTAMHKAGVYELRVMNPAHELLYIGAVGVKAAPVKPNNSVITLPEGAKAGEVGFLSVQLHDAFGNTVTDAAATDVFALVRHESDPDVDPVELHPQGMACGLNDTQYRLPFNLTRAGRYDLVVRFANDQIGSSFDGRRRLMATSLSPFTVEPGDVEIENTIITPTRYQTYLGNEQELLLYARDRFNNIATGASLVENVTNVTITPSSAAWDYSVEATLNAAARIMVRVTGNIGTYSLQAFINGERSPEPVEATIVAPPPPPPVPAPPPRPPVDQEPPSPSPHPPHSHPPPSPQPPPPFPEPEAPQDPQVAAATNDGLAREDTIAVAVIVSVVGAALIAAAIIACVVSKRKRELRYYQRYLNNRGPSNYMPPKASVYGGGPPRVSQKGPKVSSLTTASGMPGRYSGRNTHTKPKHSEVVKGMSEPDHAGLPPSYQMWLDQAKHSPDYDDEEGGSSYSRAGSDEIAQPASEVWSASSLTSPSEAAAVRASIFPVASTSPRHMSMATDAGLPSTSFGAVKGRSQAFPSSAFPSSAFPSSTVPRGASPPSDRPSSHSSDQPGYPWLKQPTPNASGSTIHAHPQKRARGPQQANQSTQWPSFAQPTHTAPSPRRSPSPHALHQQTAAPSQVHFGMPKASHGSARRPSPHAFEQRAASRTQFNLQGGVPKTSHGSAMRHPVPANPPSPQASFLRSPSPAARAGAPSQRLGRVETAAAAAAGSPQASFLRSPSPAARAGAPPTRPDGVETAAAAAAGGLPSMHEQSRRRDLQRVPSGGWPATSQVFTAHSRGHPPDPSSVHPSHFIHGNSRGASRNRPARSYASYDNPLAEQD